MSRKSLTRPFLVDGWMHAAFAVKYSIFATFGVIGALSSVPAIAEVAGGLYEFLWASSIAVVSFLLVTLVAINTRRGYVKELRTVEWEWYLTMLVVGLVGTYSAALINLSLGGSDTRDSLAVISTALLIFPIWRIRWLYRTLRGKH